MNNKRNEFLWGTVNIGQQTEGNNLYSNWDRWGARDIVPAIGRANDYWQKYEDYHNLLEEVGCNSMRITIEWSRIEPEEGVFDRIALEHYRNILKNLHERNITTVVGLWHWSVPMWFEEKYGVHSREYIKLFIEFVKRVRDELGELIDYVVVLNEPSVYISASYLRGMRPPFYKNNVRALKVFRNLIKMHKSTYRLWKIRYPRVPVGSTFLYNHEFGRDNSLIQNIYLGIKRFLQNGFMLSVLKRYSDYIGINYYTSDSFYFGKSGGKIGLHGTNDWHSSDVWKKFPEGLYQVLMKMKKYNKPIMILENGKPTESGVNDTDRQKFLRRVVWYIDKSIDEGVDVKGYFHYSLCDSYEWDSGYNFKFGLIEINRDTGRCIKRKSCDTYAQIIKDNI